MTRIVNECKIEDRIILYSDELIYNRNKHRWLHGEREGVKSTITHFHRDIT